MTGAAKIDVEEGAGCYGSLHHFRVVSASIIMVCSDERETAGKCRSSLRIWPQNGLVSLNHRHFVNSWYRVVCEYYEEGLVVGICPA